MQSKKVDAVVIGDMGYGFDYVGNFENDGPRGWEYHLIFGMPF